MSDWSDRLIEPNEEDPGATFEIRENLPGLDVHIDDETPLLDAEGNVVRELDLDRPDELLGRGATVRQLAVDEQVWRFGHVIVDEAQDLTPMQWRMIVRRSRQGSVTLLGDLAQRSVGEPGTWDDHLPPQFSLFEQQNLTVNYRSPAEVNDLASRLLEELAPDLPPSKAVRRSGFPVEFVAVDQLDTELARVVADAGQAGAAPGGGGPALAPAVIGFDLPDLDADPQVGPDGHRTLSPWLAKGLEFDSVVVVEPARFLDEPNGLSLLYVALTRSTGRLTVVHARPLPAVLDDVSSSV